MVTLEIKDQTLNGEIGGGNNSVHNSVHNDKYRLKLLCRSGDTIFLNARETIGSL